MASVEDDDGLRLVVRFARSGPAADSLAHHWRQIADLRADERLGDWRRYLPVPASWRPDEHFGYLVESHPEGVTAADHVVAGADLDLMVERIGRAITPLHERTTEQRPADAADVASWIGEPIERLGQSGLRRRLGGLDSLGARLEEAWLGRSVGVSRVMGDLALETVVVDACGEVAAFIDWRQGRWGPSAVDPAHLALTARARQRRREVGAEMAELVSTPDPGMPDTDVLLLAWLWHVDGSLQQPQGGRAGDVWLVRNVEAVLAAVDGAQDGVS